MSKNYVAAFILATLAAVPANAQAGAGGFSVGVTGGTLGIGPEISYRASNTVAIRANATFFGFSHDVGSTDIEYDGKLKLQSLGAMIDVHPFGGGFRISAGARAGSNKVRLRGTPGATETVEIGDTTYSGAQIGTLRGQVKANDFAPTATLGWGGGLTPGIKFGIEAGAMFHGTPKVERLVATGPFANDPRFQAALLRERQEIEDDIDQYKVYPILQVSLSYRF